MDILFWRKKNKENKNKVAPRRLEVPREYVFQVLNLHDALGANIHSKVADYNLWSFIEDILPETKTGSWKIYCPNAVSVVIVELIDKED